MGYYYHSMLTEKQKTLYSLLLNSMGAPSISCEAEIPDIHTAMKALLMDYPQLCFFEGKWGFDNGSIYPQYILPGQAAYQLSAAAKWISDSLSGEAYPRQVYDWMLAQIEYRPNCANSQNAYGALVQRQAVCKGIAKGYQLLMEARNIACILVEGTLDGRANHVWNMIFYQGRWEHIDVTMGYPNFWYLTGASDSYGGYRKTTKEISRSHFIYHPEILPTER